MNVLVYVFLWVWDMDQVKLIISMDTDINVYMFVCWLYIYIGANCWYMLLAKERVSREGGGVGVGGSWVERELWRHTVTIKTILL